MCKSRTCLQLIIMRILTLRCWQSKFTTTVVIINKQKYYYTEKYIIQKILYNPITNKKYYTEIINSPNQSKIKWKLNILELFFVPNPCLEKTVSLSNEYRYFLLSFISYRPSSKLYTHHHSVRPPGCAKQRIVDRLTTRFGTADRSRGFWACFSCTFNIIWGIENVWSALFKINSRGQCSDTKLLLIYRR